MEINEFQSFMIKQFKGLTMEIQLSNAVEQKYNELREYYQAHDNDIVEEAIASLYELVKVKIAILRLDKQLQGVKA